MSAHQRYVLICDAEGCGETYDSGDDRADVTRRHAAGTGWASGVIAPATRSGWGRPADFCKEHAALLPASPVVAAP